jgi:hypothetical protein
MKPRQKLEKLVHSRSNYISHSQRNILNCHYLASDLLDLAQSVPFVEIEPARQLSAALTRWADDMTLIIEDIRRIVDDRAE